MEVRELRAFIATVEQGSLSAAARSMHVSQSALSQTLRSLERQLGVRLLTRGRNGSSPTAAGEALLTEAREVVTHHDRAIAAVAAVAGGSGGAGTVRIGVPLEFPPDRLPAALAEFAATNPDAQVKVVHLSSTSQLDALRSGELDIGLVRDRPSDPQLDSVLCVREAMGVILTDAQAGKIVEGGKAHLHRLAGLQWMGFARSDAPAWHDQVTATLRGHGIAVEDQPTDDRPVTAEVKLAGIGTGKAFGFAPPGWAQPLPPGLSWYPLIDDPIVRSTWAVWPADSRDRRIAALVATLDITATG
ncbi:LysR family transcriptional regulator [Amycolatopsis sp. NPDC051903]|uniref:LysR family transcriptional regulator n=1 Tax=Amycolatopsis sp. NPDC051903 TaxID=3363936 RepID=UPI00379A377C